MAPLSSYLSSTTLSLLKRDPPSPNLANNAPTTTTPSPPAKPAQPQSPSYSPGSGTWNPRHIHNQGFFALFALLGVAFVLTAIWFFFWAKNGGFKFRQGDWDDYKSTVLRRKGPNGTTLSGATKTTELGGGSVVGRVDDDYDEKSWSRGEQSTGRNDKKVGKKTNKKRGKKNGEDHDVRAYRHEKVAKVGGLNRESDGIFNQDFAYSDTATSYMDETMSQPSTATMSMNGGGGGGHIPINTPKKKDNNNNNNHRWAKNTAKRVVDSPTTPSPKKPTSHRYGDSFYAQTPGSNTSTDSHRPLRPNAQSPAKGTPPTRSRQSSPTKVGHGARGSNGRGSMPGSYADPMDSESRYSASEAGMTEDSRGTKAYFHPIPGLGSGNGNGGGVGGFRRGRGRRDSLSDSEGETGTVMS